MLQHSKSPSKLHTKFSAVPVSEIHQTFQSHSSLILAKDTMEGAVIRMFLLFMLSTSSNPKFSSANDTINTAQSIRGNETLVSGNFELGFFSPGKSGNRYVGIWYKDVTPKTVVWVANREKPLNNPMSGIFKVIQPGIFVILNETNGIIWSSNNSRSAKDPVAQLLDTGNLVLRDEDNLHPDNYLWQSFDHPTDTYLPGMVIHNALSWKSDEDPAPGDFTLSLDRSGYPQVFTSKNGVIRYRRGPWNGVAFSGTPNARRDSSSTTALRRNREGDFYYMGDSTDSSVLSRFTLSPRGHGERWMWVHRTQEWERYLNFPLCECLDKFVPKDQEGWMRGDWTDGCVRRMPLNCTVGDGFLKYSGIKLRGSESWLILEIYLNERSFQFQLITKFPHIEGSHHERTKQDLELPMFNLSTISKATDSFSFRNRIGEGGYGPVYKGTLADGQNIAVKRLSKDSHQGPNKSLDLVLYGENCKLYVVISRG